AVFERDLTEREVTVPQRGDKSPGRIRATIKQEAEQVCVFGGGSEVDRVDRVRVGLGFGCNIGSGIDEELRNLDCRGAPHARAATALKRRQDAAVARVNE